MRNPLKDYPCYLSCRHQEKKVNNRSAALMFEGEAFDENSLLELVSTSEAKNSCLPCPEVSPAKMTEVKTISSLDPIKCAVNGIYTIECRKDNHDVFIPASFVAKYFEVGFLPLRSLTLAKLPKQCCTVKKVCFAFCYYKIMRTTGH